MEKVILVVAGVGIILYYESTLLENPPNEGLQPLGPSQPEDPFKPLGPTIGNPFQPLGPPNKEHPANPPAPGATKYCMKTDIDPSRRMGNPDGSTYTPFYWDWHLDDGVCEDEIGPTWQGTYTNGTFEGKFNDPRNQCAKGMAWPGPGLNLPIPVCSVAGFPKPPPVLTDPFLPLKKGVSGPSTTQFKPFLPPNRNETFCISSTKKQHTSSSNYPLTYYRVWDTPVYSPDAATCVKWSSPTEIEFTGLWENGGYKGVFIDPSHSCDTDRDFNGNPFCNIANLPPPTY